ncbi:MAG TPA: DUF4038 domain-containing protein [Candidatus Hydrogenedentes bacterium]|nr:DUF4038 domain-containing protein [Candidatus Hydrogenedentota bacterium]
MPHAISAIQNQVVEWRYTSGAPYNDPFNDVELDVLLRSLPGETWKVPAFWAGQQEWRVRFSPPKTGKYVVTTVCSDTSNTDLHSRTAILNAVAHDSENPLLRYGPLRVADSKRTLEHADGTPFFWLGDTWWMGLCKRLSWPEDFKRLAADRASKGFTVIQIVAGLYPDMPPFDPRSANEAGLPWQENYGRINPAYFDMADLRIQWLVRSGLVPCIVGAWGYHLPFLGVQKMKQHWRYLIARWGAYPVVWCLAGEGAMPYYLSENRLEDARTQVAGWTEIGRYVRETDPYHRLTTIHPTQVGRDQLEDDTVLDLDMLQTGHGGYGSVPNTVVQIVSERPREPLMPVIVGEVNYEGILHGTGPETQRLTFWAATLSGAAGFTYGANGLWQVNTREAAYGPSPHGGNWGDTPWEEAYQLPGSMHLSLAKCLLQRYDWPLFEPHQDWVVPCGGPENVNAPFAAGIPRQVRIIYLYEPPFPWSAEPPCVSNIEQDVRYSAFFWNPRNGQEHDLGAVQVDTRGSWQIPILPTLTDWVLVMQRRS